MSAAQRTGTVRKRQNKSGATWTAQLELDQEPATIDPETGERRPGKRNFLTRGGFATRREAQAQLDVWRDELRKGATGTRDLSVRYVTDLSERFIESQADVLRPTTHRSYSDTLRLHVLPYLGAQRVQEVDPAMIEALAVHLRTKVGQTGRGKGSKLSASSQAYALRVTSRLFSWAVEIGVVMTNPVEVWRKRAKAGTAAKRREREALDPGRVAQDLPWGRAEVRRFLDLAGGHRFESVFRLALATGALRGELVGLRWSDVDLDAGTITFQNAITTAGGRTFEGLTKSGQRRTITVDAGTVAMLQGLRSGPVVSLDARRGGYVFANPVGEHLHPQDVTDAFVDLVKASDLPPGMRLHDLRHVHGSWLLDAGHSAVAVARRLGHSRTSITTDVYGHRAEDADARIAESVADWLAS